MSQSPLDTSEIAAPITPENMSQVQKDQPVIGLSMVESHFKAKVLSGQLIFADQNIAEIVTVCKEFQIESLRVIEDHPNYVMYLADRQDLPNILFSFPRTKQLDKFTDGLTEAQLNYVNSQEAPLLSFSVVLSYAMPSEKTSKLAEQLFASGKFFQVVHNKGILGGLFNMVINRIPSTKGKLFAVSSIEDAITRMRSLETQLTSM